MRDRGYRDRPLVITEFGILMPIFYGYDYPRVRDFMLGTFDWLLGTVDPDLGYPADDNRLVQAWAWFSLAEANFEGWPTWNHLFDPETTYITDLGLDHHLYTEPLTAPYPESFDLQPTAIRMTSSAPGTSEFVTATVEAQIYNGGGGTSDAAVIRFEREGLEVGDVTLPPIEAGESAWVTVVWPDLSPGWYQVGVRADPDGALEECDRSNNRLSVARLAGGYRSYLPTIFRVGKQIVPAAQLPSPAVTSPQPAGR
jgi:hypothetical protein